MSTHVNFRKKWTITQVEVNMDTGAEVGTPVDILEVAPDSWERAQLDIPPK